MLKKLNAQIFLLCALAFGAQAQKPIPSCNCDEGCTSIITTQNNNAITVQSGEKLCVSRNGVLNGNITVKAGGELCNSGTITGFVTVENDATFCNSEFGYIKGTLCNEGYSNVINHGTLIPLNPPCDDHVKGENFENGGCSMYSSDVLLSDLENSITITGKTFIDGDFITAGIPLYVKGFLYVSGTIDLRANIIILPGGCVSAGNIDAFRTSIEGAGPGYSGLIINKPGSDGVSIQGMIDLYNVPNPGEAPQGGFWGIDIDPTVTHNTSYPNCGDTTRCDIRETKCIIEIELESAFPSNCPNLFSPKPDGNNNELLVIPPKDTGSLSVVIIEGKGPFSYEWSNGMTTQNISGLSKGVYTVTVTDESGGCQAIQTEIIAPVNDPYIYRTNVPNNPNSPYGDTLWVYPVEPAPIEYTWYIDLVQTENPNKNYYVIDKLGEFLVRTVYTPPPPDEDKPCTGFTEPMLIDRDPTNIEKFAFSSLEIYPNPSKGIIYLRTHESNSYQLSIKIFNFTGEQITDFKNEIISGNLQKLDIAGQPGGIYFLETIEANGTKNMTKIVLSE